MNFPVDSAARLAAIFAVVALLVFGLGAHIAVTDVSRKVEADSAAYRSHLQEMLNASDTLLTALVGGHGAAAGFESARAGVLVREFTRSYAHIAFAGYLTWDGSAGQGTVARSAGNRGAGGFGSSGVPARVGELAGRSGRMPLRFVEPPLADYTRLLGLDLASNDRLSSLFERAIVSGRPERAYLDRSPWGGAPVLVVVKMTYGGHGIPATERTRRERFDGAFVLFHELERLKALAGDAFEASRIRVMPPLADEGEPAIPGVVDVFGNLGQGLQFRSVIPLPGTDRLVQLERHLPWLQVWRRGHLFAAAAGGILAAFLFLIGDYRRQSHIEIAKANARADEERDRAQATLFAIGDAVISVSPNWRIDYINPEAERLLSVSTQKAVGSPIGDHVHLRNSESGTPVSDLAGYFNELLDRSEPTAVHLITSDGREVAVDSRVSRFKGHEGGRVIVMRDVSIERELTDELAFQASHDMLTGLLNRTAFEGSVKAAIEQSQIGDCVHAVIYIDLDRFKLVNDSGGHAAGDEVLRRVAGILQAQLRDGDLLARIGGDEFGVLMHHCELTVAIEVADRLRNAVADFRFRWHEKIFDIQASLGVVPIRQDSGPLDDVLTAVDLACHVAKERGRNSLHVHRTEDDIVDRRRAEMRWLPRLKDALEDDRFELFLQPMAPTDAGSGLPAIHEFLVRLRDDDGGHVCPALFVPSAERYDLIREIDRWVIAAACDLLARTSASTDAVYSINLSGQSISDDGFSEYVHEQLKRTGIPPRLLAFEITETSAIANLARAQDFVARIRSLGCSIMLDDFGSGLSSFGYLKNLQIDYIKIDGQFVRDVATDPVDETMVRMIHEIAEVLRVRTVAEWVEDADVLAKVRSIGIDYGQGFHIARPVPAQDMLERKLRLVT